MGDDGGEDDEGWYDRVDSLWQTCDQFSGVGVVSEEDDFKRTRRCVAKITICDFKRRGDRCTKSSDDSWRTTRANLMHRKSVHVLILACKDSAINMVYLSSSEDNCHEILQCGNEFQWLQSGRRLSRARIFLFYCQFVSPGGILTSAAIFTSVGKHFLLTVNVSNVMILDGEVHRL